MLKNEVDVSSCPEDEYVPKVLLESAELNGDACGENFNANSRAIF